MLVTFVILVTLLLLRLLLLLHQGMGWQLLGMADVAIGRTMENHMLASVAATKPQG